MERMAALIERVSQTQSSLPPKGLITLEGLRSPTGVCSPESLISPRRGYWATFCFD
jgi:hypothetical protein